MNKNKTLKNKIALNKLAIVNLEMKQN